MKRRVLWLSLLSYWSLMLRVFLVAFMVVVTSSAAMSRECRLGSEPVRVFKELGGSTILLNAPTLSAVSATQYFAANFSSILLIDFDQASVTHVPIIGLGDRKIQPAGVYYDPGTRLLFSADYLLNKVRVFRFDGHLLTFEFEIGGLTSPEGVFFDTATSMLMIAEFDGHHASGWHLDITAKSAEQRWRVPVKYAHGIAARNGKVYVSGLYKRSIVVLAQETGATLDEFGSTGWDPTKLQYLWPTTLAFNQFGRLLVADADTGYISALDVETKRVVGKIGGAGPGRGLFSQPYAVAAYGDRVAIYSTKDERFTLTDSSLCPLVSMYRRDGRWQPNVIAEPFKTDEGSYRWSDGPRVSLNGLSYVISNSSLVAENGSHDLNFYGTKTPYGGVNYKQLQIASYGSDRLIFSPYTIEGPTFLRRKNDQLFAFDFPAMLNRDSPIFNCWTVSDRPTCADRRDYDLATMAGLFDKYVARVEGSRCSNGYVPFDQMRQAILETRTAIGGADETDDPLTPIIVSKAGKAFLNLYSKLASCSDIDRVRGDLAAVAPPNNISRTFFEAAVLSVIMPGTH